MPKKKQILFPVFFMILVTVVFTFFLAFINEVTKETIADQEALTIEKSILYCFNVDTEGMDDEEIHDLFLETIEISETSNETYFVYKEKSDIKGYAVAISGKGLWGTISGHIAFSADHSNVLGVNFTAHSETPGLGGRIDEDVYKEQFRNTSLDVSKTLYVNNKDTGGNVDAITGATLTSKAVITIYNDFLPGILEQAKKEGYYEGN